MARAGTPIRLVREDGGLIELLAYNIVMSTERKFALNKETLSLQMLF